MNVFQKLRPEIRGILARQGIDAPTPPQEKAVLRILAGENVLLISAYVTAKSVATIRSVV